VAFEGLGVLDDAGGVLVGQQGDAQFGWVFALRAQRQRGGQRCGSEESDGEAAVQHGCSSLGWLVREGVGLTLSKAADDVDGGA